MVGTYGADGEDRNPRQIIEALPDGRGTRGRPRNTCMDSIDETI